MGYSKSEVRFFTIAEWEKEQDYLRKQHNIGWKFVGVNAMGWYHFEKCEPDDVVYQLDYNQEGISHKEEYIRMFNDCGWEYIQDYVGYSYFRKPASQMCGNEEIFCDNSSRFEMIKRVLKGRMGPLLVIFFVFILPNIYVQGSSNTPISNILLFVMICLFVLYLVIFSWLGYQFIKYWKRSR